MYGLMILRYRASMPAIEAATEQHRSYLRDLQARGIVLASGPFDPRTGGAILVRLPSDGPTMESLRDADPFHQQGLVEYELLAWNPGIGRDSLNRL